jgi:hypothetical protein
MQMLLLEHLLPIFGYINSWLGSVMQYTLNANCDSSEISTLHRHGSTSLREKIRRAICGASRSTKRRQDLMDSGGCLAQKFTAKVHVLSESYRE